MPFWASGALYSLRAQADSNRETAGELIENQQRQREATQALTQESMNAYMDFLNSMFSYYQGNLERAQSDTQRNLDRAPGRIPSATWTAPRVTRSAT